MTKRILILAVLALGACGDDDGTTIVDSGPTTGDAGPVSVDAGPTPDTGTGTDEVDRYLTLELLDGTQFCECAVSAGDFADVDTCIAADPAAISTEAELTCLRAELAGASAADQANFACRNDSGSAQLDCRGALSCEDYTATPRTAAWLACEDVADMAYDACGTPSNEQALGDCFD